MSLQVLPDKTSIAPGPKTSSSPGHPRTSQDVLLDLTTKVLGSKFSRSPGTTQNILEYPTRHDYQSPRSKDPNLEYPRMSYKT